MIPKKRAYKRKGIKNKIQKKQRLLYMPLILDDLVVSEAITRSISIQAMYNEIVTAHYTNDTAVHKMLKLLLKCHTNKKAYQKFKLEFEMILDSPKVSQQEIDASRYESKKRYVKHHVKPPEKIPEKKISIFDIDTIKKPPM